MRLRPQTFHNPLCKYNILHTLNNSTIPVLFSIVYTKQRRGKYPHRAIASVVTSAIILSAVSVLGVMLLGWSNTSLLQQKQEIEEVYSTRMNKINENLIFENIWFATTPAPNHLNVTISNVGILGLNVTNIRVTNSTASNGTAFNFAHTDGGIVTGGSFSTNATYAWQSGDVLDVMVFTDRGNQFTTRVIAP